MKSAKRLLLVILAIISVTALMLAVALNSSAATVREVSSYKQLYQALTSEENIKIVLADDIDYDMTGRFNPICITGVKELDLAGNTIKITYTAGTYDKQYLDVSNHMTLFNLDASADFTVGDSVGNGTIHFDAYLGDAEDFIISPICDMFNIREGKLTINGGIFVCGHEKKDWVTAIYINDKLFTGYLRSQVYGTVFDVGGSAELIINGGSFTGRGGFVTIDRSNRGAAYSASVIKAHSGSEITINSGSFYGLGGAGIFNNPAYGDIDINNGVFETKGISNALIRYNNIDAATIKPSYNYITDDMVDDGLETKIFLADDNVYTFAAYSQASKHFIASDDLIIYTALRFDVQSPSMQEGMQTAVLDAIPLGTSKIISFREAGISQYFSKLGYSIAGDMVVRNSDNEIVKVASGTGIKSLDLKDITEPGNYNITQRISLINSEGTVSKLERIFIIEIYDECEHSYELINNTATCTKVGYKIYICSACGDEHKVLVRALGHACGSSGWSYDADEHWLYCYRCNQEVSNDEHTYTGGVCTVCEYNNNCSWDNAMDTEYDDTYHWRPCDTHSADNCPNGNKLGKERHTVRAIENAGALDNTPTTEYSCQNGYVCAGCGEYFGATGEHKWVVDSYVPAICNIDGSITYKCAYDGEYDCKGNLITCNATKVIKEPANGHTFNYDAPVSNTATCTEDGVCTYRCTVRGCFATTTVASGATGHLFTDWSVIDEATCVSDGHLIAYCDNENCNATDTKTVSATGEHDFTREIVDEAHLLQPADYVNPAFYRYTCQDCDAVSDSGFTYGDKLSLGTPSGLTDTQTTNAITLKWNAVEGATGYRVFVRNTTTNKWDIAIKTTGKKTTATLTGLNPGTRYTYAVRAYVNVGTIVWAPKFATIYSGTQPPVITTLKAAPSATSVKLTWGKVVATGYRVFQYNTSTKKWDIIVKSTKGTTATITGLTAGKSYIFCVRPYLNTSTKIVWAKTYTKVSTATVADGLATPGIKGWSSAAGRATIGWDKVSGALGYQLYYSTNKTSGYKKISNYSGTSTYHYGLESGKTYYYRVRAYAREGSGYTYSSFSPVLTVVAK